MSTDGWVRAYGPGEFRDRDGWHVRGKDIYGRRFEGRLPPEISTQGAAERAARRILGEANRRAPAPAPAPVESASTGPDHSFKAAAWEYRRIRRPSKADWDRIEKLIACEEIGPVDVRELTTVQAAKFAEDTMHGRAPDTLNREVIAMYSAVLKYAAEIQWCTKLVIRRFRESEDENIAIRPEEVDKLIANADQTGKYPKGAHALKDKKAAYKVALLEFLRLRGTRISDALKLHRQHDLDLPGGRVRLTIGKLRDKVRWLPLTPKVVALFANLPACEGGYLFPWRTRSGVYKWYTPLRKTLGIAATPHKFRHALGEEMIDAGMDLLTLKGAMAAASLNSVRRYARTSRKRLEEADRLREQEARRSTHGTREMVAADLETSPAEPPDADNVVSLERKSA